MKSEIGSMHDNKVWTLVDLPDDRRAIENKWIFMKKTDIDDNHGALDQVTIKPRRSTRVRTTSE